MFNPYCRETKGCFNPTVRGEGGSGEGRGRRGCGCVGGVGADSVRLFSLYCHSVKAHTSRNTQPLGLRQLSCALKKWIHTPGGGIPVDTRRDEGDVSSALLVGIFVHLITCCVEREDCGALEDLQVI